MADVVLQAPIVPHVPDTQPDLIHDEDDIMAASPQESDAIPTPSDDPIHFPPTTTKQPPSEDIDMNDADGDRDDADDDNISVDMDIGSPPVPPSTSLPAIQAPPSPAPSGESSSQQPPIQRSPPTTTVTPSISVNGFSNPDHPEHSIPSPASPTAASLPVESIEPAEPVVEQQEQQQLPVTAPATLTASVSSPLSAKHEHEDADAMDEQRPAKRARTADVASVSVFSTLHFISSPSVFVDAFYFATGVRHRVFRPRRRSHTPRGEDYLLSVIPVSYFSVLTALHSHASLSHLTCIWRRLQKYQSNRYPLVSVSSTASRVRPLSVRLRTSSSPISCPISTDASPYSYYPLTCSVQIRSEHPPHPAQAKGRAAVQPARRPHRTRHPSLSHYHHSPDGLPDHRLQTSRV